MCRGCGTYLVARASDIKIGHFGANWGGEEPTKRPYFVCPSCDNHIILDWDVVRADVIASIK
jgi:hypothetical protein